MLTTTLNKIKEHKPCKDRWALLLKALGKTKADDEPLPFITILKILGLDDALWCCRSAPKYNKEWRLYEVLCARQVEHLHNGQSSLAALDVAERYANGLATEQELAAAGAAAGAAVCVAVVAAQTAKFREVCNIRGEVRRGEEMKDKILRLIDNNIKRAEDNVYRSRMQFGRMTTEQLDKEYGQSGRKCKDILMESEAAVKEAIDMGAWFIRKKI